MDLAPGHSDADELPREVWKTPGSARKRPRRQKYQPTLPTPWQSGRVSAPPQRLRSSPGFRNVSSRTRETLTPGNFRRPLRASDAQPYYSSGRSVPAHAIGESSPPEGCPPRKSDLRRADADRATSCHPVLTQPRDRPARVASRQHSGGKGTARQPIVQYVECNATQSSERIEMKPESNRPVPRRSHAPQTSIDNRVANRDP